MTGHCHGYPLLFGCDRHVRNILLSQLKFPILALLQRPTFIRFLGSGRLFHWYVVHPASRIRQMMPFVSDLFRTGYHEIPQLLRGYSLHCRQLAPILARQHGEETLREVDEREEQAEDHHHEEKVLLINTKFT